MNPSHPSPHTIRWDVDRACELLMAEPDAYQTPVHPASFERWRIWLGSDAVAIAYRDKVLVQVKNAKLTSHFLLEWQSPIATRCWCKGATQSA